MDGHRDRDGDEDGVDDQGADAKQPPPPPRFTRREGTDLSTRIIASHMPATNGDGKHLRRMGTTTKQESITIPECCSPFQTRTVKKWSRI